LSKNEPRALIKNKCNLTLKEKCEDQPTDSLITTIDNAINREATIFE